MSSDSQSTTGVSVGSDPVARTVVQPHGSGEDAPRLERAPKRPLERNPDPETIGRYTIVRRIGAGGMSLVYAARDEELDREVAIKLLQHSFAKATGWRGRLRREAQSMAKLSHVNIAHVYEVGDHEGSPYITMELIRGSTLGEWLGERERSVPEIIAMFVQAARGLAAAHHAGLVHRDFKPDNVIVDESGWARVLDFGLVLAPAERHDVPTDDLTTPDRPGAAPDATQPGTVLGTPAYMAPEQMRGSEIDARADQFAFCVALYEALYGHRPFTGASLAELASAKESGAHLLDTVADSRVPAAIADVLGRGLHAKPDRRYADMGELIAALDVAMQQRQRSALEQTVVDRDFTRNRDVRMKLLILDGAVLGGAAAVLTVARLAGLHRAGYLDAVIVLTIFWVANLMYRRQLVSEANAINRRWHLMTMIIPPLLLIHFGLCAWAGLDFTTALALATVLGAGVLTGASSMVDNANPVLPAGLLITAVAIVGWPAMRGVSLCLGVVGTFLASRWVLRRRAALQDPDP